MHERLFCADIFQLNDCIHGAVNSRDLEIEYMTKVIQGHLYDIRGKFNMKYSKDDNVYICHIIIGRLSVTFKRKTFPSITTSVARFLCESNSKSDRQTDVVKCNVLANGCTHRNCISTTLCGAVRRSGRNDSNSCLPQRPKFLVTGYHTALPTDSYTFTPNNIATMELRDQN